MKRAGLPWPLGPAVAKRGPSLVIDPLPARPPRPRRVRSEIVLRRFMAGDAVACIGLDLKIGNMLVEQIIRRALNKPRKK